MRRALQVVPIRVHGNAESHEDTMALCDTGSSQTWFDQELLEKLNLDGEEVTIHVTGIHGTSPIQSKKVEVTLGPAESNAANKCTIWVNSHKNLAVGKEENDLRPLKRKFGYLSCIRQNTIRLAEVKVILAQDAFPLICPVAHKHGGVNTSWAVKLPLAWTISGPLPTSEKAQCYSVCGVSKDEELTAVVKQWGDLESYGTVVAVDNRSFEDKQALAHLNDTIRFNDGRYSVGLLWNGQENLQNNYSAALSQLKSLESRLGKDGKLKERYSETIEKDLKKGYVSQLETSEVHSDKTCWYLPHHPVLNPNKPEKVRRVCKAASKFRGISLNDVQIY